jgi:hypothetical protein
MLVESQGNKKEEDAEGECEEEKKTMKLLNRKKMMKINTKMMKNKMIFVNLVTKVKMKKSNEANTKLNMKMNVKMPMNVKRK